MIKTVIQQYADVSEVQSIYYDVVDGWSTFYIFTSNERYDDSLMDRLIERELQILQAFPDANISIEYWPLVLCQPRDVLMSQDAKRIA